MTTIAHLEAPSRSAVRKLTATFASRAEAKKAVLELRQAGYTARQIRILGGVPAAALEKEDVGDLISRYVRHLVSPRRVMIRVNAPDIENAMFILRNLGAEVALNQFYHQSPARTQPQGGSVLPIRRWSE